MNVLNYELWRELVTGDRNRRVHPPQTVLRRWHRAGCTVAEAAAVLERHPRDPRPEVRNRERDIRHFR